MRKGKKLLSLVLAMGIVSSCLTVWAAEDKSPSLPDESKLEYIVNDDFTTDALVGKEDADIRTELESMGYVIGEGKNGDTLSFSATAENGLYIQRNGATEAMNIKKTFANENTGLTNQYALKENYSMKNPGKYYVEYTYIYEGTSVRLDFCNNWKNVWHRIDMNTAEDPKLIFGGIKTDNYTEDYKQDGVIIKNGEPVKIQVVTDTKAGYASGNREQCLSDVYVNGTLVASGVNSYYYYSSKTYYPTLLGNASFGLTSTAAQDGKGLTIKNFKVAKISEDQSDLLPDESKLNYILNDDFKTEEFVGKSGEEIRQTLLDKGYEISDGGTNDNFDFSANATDGLYLKRDGSVGSTAGISLKKKLTDETGLTNEYTLQQGVNMKDGGKYYLEYTYKYEGTSVRFDFVGSYWRNVWHRIDLSGNNPDLAINGTGSTNGTLTNNTVKIQVIVDAGEGNADGNGIQCLSDIYMNGYLIAKDNNNAYTSGGLTKYPTFLYQLSTELKGGEKGIWLQGFKVAKIAEDPVVTDTAIEISNVSVGDQVTLTANLTVDDTTEMGGKLIMALYDENNNLVNVKLYDAAATVNVAAEKKGAASAKLMWWNMDDETSYCDAQPVDLTVSQE